HVQQARGGARPARRRRPRRRPPLRRHPRPHRARRHRRRRDHDDDTARKPVMTDTTPAQPATPAFPAGSVLGYPRIGPRRELKKALEAFWAGRTSAEEVEAVAADLRRRTRTRLAELGLPTDAPA